LGGHSCLVPCLVDRHYDLTGCWLRLLLFWHVFARVHCLSHTTGSCPLCLRISQFLALRELTDDAEESSTKASRPRSSPEASCLRPAKSSRGDSRFVPISTIGQRSIHSVGEQRRVLGSFVPHPFNAHVEPDHLHSNVRPVPHQSHPCALDARVECQCDFCRRR